MKKLMALTLALLMTLSLAACGGKTEQSAPSGDNASTETAAFVPSKNITWICTSSAGGGSDIFSRKIADIMKITWSTARPSSSPTRPTAPARSAATRWPP